ncbi:MAG: branched-chain amino acid ABC transporter permease, partial [Bacillota bacterium]|nr:branched-chain amino acid ABC transporter permease [Bacillota bacterium]
MKNNNIKNIALIIIAVIALFVLNQVLDSYQSKIINLCGIYIVLALSLNLVNGDTGLFSLGHAGFMAVGAYTLAILTMPAETKEMNYYMQPMVPWLMHLNIPY